MKKFLKWFILPICFLYLILSIPEIFYTNQGKSKAIGYVWNGALENPYLIPYSGPNFRYFSPFSYYILNNAYLHSSVAGIVSLAYKECEKTCPGIQFRLMECANKNGGKMYIHRTHQNGLSVDFMIPKKKDEDQSRLFDKLGIWHYLLEFDNQGVLKFNKNIEIDFESMAKHILAIDHAARKLNLKIKKVIFKIELKDELFATENGKELKRRGIYFAQSLSETVNKLHDDHYHIDFEIL